MGLDRVEFNKSGLDPFMSTSMSKGVAATYAMRHRPSKGFGYMGQTSIPTKDIFDEARLIDFYNKNKGFENLYNMARTKPIGFDPRGFGIIEGKGTHRRGFRDHFVRDFDHEEEISLLMPSLFTHGTGTGTAKSSLMRIGYDNFPANRIKGGGRGMFRSKAEQDAAYPDSVHLGSSLSPTEAFLKNLAGGFVPNFNPLGRAISAERMGLKQMGSSARPQVGYDARVGIGVFNSSQGSLSNAINQHLMAGQRPSTLKSTGAAKGGDT